MACLYWHGLQIRYRDRILTHINYLKKKQTSFSIENEVLILKMINIFA
jgi:hypothetical protein